MCHLWILIFIPHDFESSGQWSMKSTVAAAAAAIPHQRLRHTASHFRVNSFIYLLFIFFFHRKKEIIANRKVMPTCIVRLCFETSAAVSLQTSDCRATTISFTISFWDRIVLYLCDDYLFIPRRRRRRHWMAEYLRRHRLILTFSFNTI